MHSMSQACSTNQLEGCTCDTTGGKTREAWLWGGCGDNIKLVLCIITIIRVQWCKFWRTDKGASHINYLLIFLNCVVLLIMYIVILVICREKSITLKHYIKHLGAFHLDIYTRSHNYTCYCEIK